MKRIGLWAVSLLLLTATVSSAEMVSRIAAVVNEDIITTYQLDQALQQQLESMERRPSPAQLGPMRKTVLKKLIEETLVQQRIRALNLTVSEEEIETAILDVQKQNNLTREQLVEALLAQGMTAEAYRSNLRKQIMRYKLISAEVRSKVDVTEKEVLSYFRAHVDDYRLPATVTLSAISFPLSDADSFQREATLQAAEEAYQRLQAGESFEQVAEDYSLEYNASSSSLGTFANREMTPEMLSAVESIESGIYAHPVEKGEAVHLLRVDERDKGGMRQFNAVKGEIYQLIYDQKTDARLKQWTKGLEKKAFIDVRL